MTTHLVYREVDACIWDYADDVWQISPVETLDSVRGVHFACAVRDARILSCLAQHQARL